MNKYIKRKRKGRRGERGRGGKGKGGERGRPFSAPDFIHVRLTCVSDTEAVRERGRIRESEENRDEEVPYPGGSGRGAARVGRSLTKTVLPRTVGESAIPRSWPSNIGQTEHGSAQERRIDEATVPSERTGKGSHS